MPVGRRVGAIFVSQGLLMDYVCNTGWQLLSFPLECGRAMSIIKCLTAFDHHSLRHEQKCYLLYALEREKFISMGYDQYSTLKIQIISKCSSGK